MCFPDQRVILRNEADLREPDKVALGVAGQGLMGHSNEQKSWVITFLETCELDRLIFLKHGAFMHICNWLNDFSFSNRGLG